MSAALTAPVEAYLAGMNEVPGWFNALDGWCFAMVDRFQRQQGVSGDVVEIGVFKGKSAILLGLLLRPGEEFLVCDLFGAAATASDNARENQRWYPDLTRAEFETNYLRFHDRLPRIVAGPSTDLRQLPGRSCRLIHVDGGHDYDVVRVDLDLARRLLVDGGCVIVDDWRTAVTPGVAAATWEAVLRTGLLPFAVTDQKLYGTWNPAGAPDEATIRSWVADQGTVRTGNGIASIEVETHQVLGRGLARFSGSLRPVEPTPRPRVGPKLGRALRLARGTR